MLFTMNTSNWLTEWRNESKEYNEKKNAMLFARTDIKPKHISTVAKEIRVFFVSFYLFIYYIRFHFFVVVDIFFLSSAHFTCTLILFFSLLIFRIQFDYVLKEKKKKNETGEKRKTENEDILHNKHIITRTMNTKTS